MISPHLFAIRLLHIFHSQEKKLSFYRKNDVIELHQSLQFSLSSKLETKAY